MNKLEFLIDGQSAEVNEEIDFTRIYRGIETTDENKNNYSLTVKFPFTYENQKIFLRSNSLSYKSDFPYQTHTCIVKSNGITLIDGTIVLLSTTENFECSIVWQPADLIGAILNNTTKLGNYLYDFDLLDWNYTFSLMNLTYSNTKATTYGYITYNDGGGKVGNASTKYFSHPHPVINFEYLLQLVFDKIGAPLNIPTPQSDFLKNLVIRPNKEFDMNRNNIFTAYVDATPWIYFPFFYASRITYLPENFTGGGEPSFGNNSYYFKSWIDSVDGEDDFFANVSSIPQIYRFKSFANSTSVLTISDFVAGTGDLAILKRYSVNSGTWITLFTVTGNGSHTITVDKDDWLAFEVDFDNTKFKVEINTPIDVTLTTPNELRFPSLFHVPTCIDLTVGEFVTEALQLSGCELSFDANTGEYNFTAKSLVNKNGYDITKHVTGIKEITYDSKYIYSKLAQSNIFKYLSTTPIDADYIISAANPSLVPEKTFIDSKFTPSEIQVGGTYNGLCVTTEHGQNQFWTSFVEKPLHLLWNDSANSKIVFTSDLQMSNIVALWWQSYVDDLLALVLSGTVRVVQLYADINDVVFKRISTSSPVYIETFGKYYGIIEIEKTGDDCIFTLLELF